MTRNTMRAQPRTSSTVLLCQTKSDITYPTIAIPWQTSIQRRSGLPHMRSGRRCASMTTAAIQPSTPRSTSSPSGISPTSETV